MLRLEDIYVPFQNFIDQVIVVEELPAFNVNMFETELANPNEFYAVRYPYFDKSMDRAELLARLGIMTDSIINKQTYEMLQSRPDIRLLLNGGMSMAYPFQPSDQLMFSFIPETVIPEKIIGRQKMEMFMDHILYDVHVHIHSNNPTVPDRAAMIGGVFGSNLEKYRAELERQIADQSLKIVHVSSSNV